MSLFLKASAAALVLSVSVPAIAATVVPTNSFASSQEAAYPAAFAYDNNTGAAFTDWASAANVPSSGALYHDFDLGAVYTLTGARVVDRVTSGGAQGTPSFGTDNYTTAFRIWQIDGLNGATIGPRQIFINATPTGMVDYNSFVKNISFSPNFETRFIRYQVVGGNGTSQGLSDIYFTGEAVGLVPEPASWAMMLGGFGLLGGAVRRRRSLKTVTA